MGICESYCSHGGRCHMTSRHKPPHDSGYCTWTDAEALNKAQADAILRTKEGGAEYLDYGGSAIEDMLTEITRDDDE